ncbi:MAG: hypothetical protein ACYC51_09340 [Thermoleophilia bacterium]
MKHSNQPSEESAGQAISQTSPEAGRALDEAIISALCYADIFSFALTVEEIVRFAPKASLTIGTATDRLNSSEALQAIVGREGQLFHLAGREANCQRRLDRETESKQQLEVALKRLIPLQGIPFLRAAAVTGALAAFNSPAGDDIDLLIIASRGRTWIAYFFMRIWRRFGHNPDICFNVFLTEGDLVFRNQNLFYAREILGALPVFNTSAFERFIEANLWVFDIFPSYSPDPVRQGYLLASSPRWRRRQQLAEKVMAGLVGDLLEYILRKIQSRSLIKASPGAALSMRRNRIKLHKVDNRNPILDKYNQRAGVWMTKYREAAGEKPVRSV